MKGGGMDELARVPLLPRSVHREPKVDEFSFDDDFED